MGIIAGPFVLLLVALTSTTPSIASSFVDIYTATFFNVDPPFTCKSSKANQGRRLSEDSSSKSIFNLGNHNYNNEEFIDSMFASDSPLATAAKYDASELARQLEKDLTSNDSTSITSAHLRQRRDADINTVSLIQSISETLFSERPHEHNEELVVEAEQAPGGVVEDEEDDENERELDGSANLSLFSGPFNPMNLMGFIGSGEIMLCAASEIFKARNQPENVGTILCRCAKRSIRREGTCRVVSSLSSTLGCSAFSTCPSFASRPYVPPLDESSANLPMTSTLPSPAEIPTSTVNDEMQTYYLLWKSVSLLSYEALHASCNSQKDPPATISGWDVQITANLVETKENGKGERTPFARLASRSNAENPELIDFLISVRGTMTSAEWAIDFSYNHVLQKLDWLDSTPLHRGFAALGLAVWSPFQLQLQEAADNGKLGLITITGHSLGGGVAAVLAHLSSKQFPSMLPDGNTPRTRAVLFAPGRAGGAKLMSDLSKVVVRTLSSTFDPVPQIPCDNFPGCSSDFVPVATARDLRSDFAFSQYPGIVHVTGDKLTPDFLKGNGINLKVMAWHICAYDCFTSLHADPTHLSSCNAPPADPKNPSSVCPYL